MANEIVFPGTTGATYYLILFDAAGRPWGGSAFAAYSSAAYATYPVAAAEYGGGVFRASMPAVPAGSYSFVAKRRAGGTPAEPDPPHGSGTVEWDGAAVLPLAARLDEIESGITVEVNAGEIAGLIVQQIAPLAAVAQAGVVGNTIALARGERLVFSVSGGPLAGLSADDAASLVFTAASSAQPEKAVYFTASVGDGLTWDAGAETLAVSVPASRTAAARAGDRRWDLWRTAPGRERQLYAGRLAVAEPARSV